MIGRLRRHARLIAGSFAILLIAGLAFVLRSAGTAHARPERAITQTITGRAGTASPLAGRSLIAAAAASTPAPVRGSAGRLAGHSSAEPRGPAAATRRAGGLPTPAPTSRALALVLRQTTGLSPSQVTSRPVCARAAAGHASCAAETLVLRSSGARVRPRVATYRSLGHVRPALARAQPATVSSAAPPQPATPAYLQQAYDLSYLSQTAGSADTVAIVDAYNNPRAEADLGTYRSTYGLPACTTANGCFRKVNQTGGSSPLPATDSGWSQEISLDLDAVSAVCPLCHILLVEANSNSFSDLQAAMQTAVSLGANQISASWSGTSSSVPGVFHTFSGVATVAASGDYGYASAGQNNYPAALPGVTAAGGTSLAPAATPTARGFSEGAWSWNGLNGGGSGCDLHYSRPVYQPAAGCSGRAYADVSAVADPSTGLEVYGNDSWSLVGGTSLSAPVIAAYYAITGVSSGTPRWAYANSGLLNDVVSGSTGRCDSSIAYICAAGPGYDGPTGVGSISGSVVTGAPGIGGPVVSSGSGSYTQSVAAHGVTIGAGVYRNGVDTSWWIEYGTSTAYGSQTAASDIGAGGSPVAVTGYLSQLSPGTTYHYRLVARNSLGTTYGYDYSFTTAAAAAAAPTAAFAASPTAPTPGSPVSFDASASAAGTGGSISDYGWSFGDGTTTHTATATASHAYPARGSYTVTLTVTSNGQTDVTTRAVTVDDAPTAAVTPSATAVAPGTAVAFDGSASVPGAGGTITDYSWSFGDGSSSDTGTAGHASHTFTTAGTYTVTLTTTDDLYVASTVTAQITVAPFTASPAVPAPGSPVTFTALGSSPSGATTSYTWDFGDSSPLVTTTSPTTTHTYSARGPYTVKLTVQNSTNGASATSTSANSTATLTVDAAPTAAFAASATAVTPVTPINFDAGASSAASGGSITHYSWDFGDDSSPQDTGATAHAAHTYANHGTYTITLTTTDDLGVTATTSQQVTVDQPVPAFTTSPTTPAPGTAASFDASNSSDPEATITHYSWDFGDGSSSQDTGATAAATHNYGTAGTYAVRLSVTNNLGLSATTSQQVVVAPVATQTVSTPVPAPTAPTAPVSSPAPAPPASPTPPATSPLSASVTAAGKQRLAPALAHGLRLSVAVNQPTTVILLISIPVSQTKQGGHVTHGSRAANRAPAVLLRRAQTLSAGTYAMTLRLSRAAAGRLLATGPLVLTVRITVAGAGGVTLTRSAKITLTR